METRLLIAYALMLVMVLAGAGIGFGLWYTSHRKTASRQRLRDQRRHDESMAEKGAGRGEDPARPPGYENA